MADVLFLAVLTAFFGVCVAFVRAVDRMLERGADGTDAARTDADVRAG